MHVTPISALVMLREGNKNITKRVWTLPNEPIMITDMRKLNIRFTKKKTAA